MVFFIIDLCIDVDAQHIEMLKTQVQLLTTQLTLLTDKRARKKKARAQAAMMQLTQENARLDSSDCGSDCIHVRNLLDYDYDSEGNLLDYDYDSEGNLLDCDYDSEAEWEEDEPGEELKSEDDMDDDEGITDCEASIAG